MACIKLLPSEIIRKGNYPAPNKLGYNSLFFHEKMADKRPFLKEFGKQIYIYCEENNIPYYCFINDTGLKINVYPNELINVFPFKIGTTEDDDKVKQFIHSPIVENNILLKELISKIQSLQKEVGDLKNINNEYHKITHDKIDIISIKIDDLYENLSKDFDFIKKSNLDLANKIEALNNKLDKDILVPDVESADVEKALQIKISHWNRLNEKSRKFLITAEWLLKGFQNKSDFDYSPYIIQYCRAYENELIHNMFYSFHETMKNKLQYLKDEENNIKREIEKKTANSETIKTLSVFAGFCKKLKMEVPQFELGGIEFILEKLSSGRAYISVAEKFHESLLSKFSSEILSNTFRKGIGKIREDFRNKSAHPNLMNLELANSCRIKVEEEINELYRIMKT